MAVADIGKVSIDGGNTHLLEIRGAAGRAGKADIGRRLAAEILGGDVAGQRSAEFSVDPIAQCVGLQSPMSHQPGANRRRRYCRDWWRP